MSNKVVLKEPFNVAYEGRILNSIVRVYEIRLLRSGKPYRVYGKDVNNPQEQAAPYDFEYLDWESQEKINNLILNGGLPIIEVDYKNEKVKTALAVSEN